MAVTVAAMGAGMAGGPPGGGGFSGGGPGLLGGGGAFSRGGVLLRHGFPRGLLGDRLRPRRHCTQRSGGQVLRRDLSLTSGSSTYFAIRRRDWLVASLIRSTKTGLSAMARSCEKPRLRRPSLPSTA